MVYQCVPNLAPPPPLSQTSHNILDGAKAVTVGSRLQRMSTSIVDAWPKPRTQRKPTTAASIADPTHIFGYASGPVTVIE
jgi:hypothetical protein